MEQVGEEGDAGGDKDEDNEDAGEGDQGGCAAAQRGWSAATCKDQGCDCREEDSHALTHGQPFGLNLREAQGYIEAEKVTLLIL